MFLAVAREGIFPLSLLPFGNQINESFQDLPLGSMASTYGLLQLPKMPELKNQDLSDFTAVDFDTNTVPYKDKQREAIRQKKLEIYRETGKFFFVLSLLLYF